MIDTYLATYVVGSAVQILLTKRGKALVNPPHLAETGEPAALHIDKFLINPNRTLHLRVNGENLPM